VLPLAVLVVRADVLVQVGLLVAGKVAVRAGLVAQVLVDLHVLAQVVAAAKDFLAHLARERGKRALVAVERLLAPELATAQVACGLSGTAVVSLEGFLVLEEPAAEAARDCGSGVHGGVSSQVGWLLECLVTDATSFGTLPSLVAQLEGLQVVLDVLALHCVGYLVFLGFYFWSFLNIFNFILFFLQIFHYFTMFLFFSSIFLFIFKASI
jgi:hypothetical protein